MTMTITQALNELKLLDKRIMKEKEMGYITTVAISKKEILGIPTEEWANNVKAKYQSIKDLIVRRNHIKNAVVESNASTEVKVGEETMTVAAAIERKTSIQYEKTLLNEMKRQYSMVLTDYDRKNKKTDEVAEELLRQILAKDRKENSGKASETDKMFIEKYKEENKWVLIDPLGLEKEIQNLEHRIDDFEKNVDTALVLSNATTFIE